MTRIRSAVPALLLAGLAAAAFLHCGRGGASGVTVTYNCAANANDIAALEREKAALLARAGVDLKLLPFSGDEKLYAMIAANQAPDIFYTNTVMRDRLAAEGRLLDLRALAGNDPLLQRLLPSVLARGAAADSGLYSIANWSFGIGVYFNRAAFDEAGLRYPDTSWTWSDLAAAAKRLTRDADGDGAPDRYGVYIGSHFVEALETMNHAPLERDAAALSIPPESREAWSAYLALIGDGAMPDARRMQALGMQAPQLLQNGRVAMLVEAVPHPALFASLTIPWGVAPLPRFGAKAPRAFMAESGGLAISASTAHPKEAWAALSWLVTDASIYQPNPVLRDVDAAAEWERRMPRLAGTGFRETMQWNARHAAGDDRFFVRFSSWTMNAIMQRLQPKLDALWARKTTVDEVCAAVPRINAEVKRELADELRSPALRPAFRARLAHQYQAMP
jgi:multiple sugar transport system substrate-binding protein